MAIDIFHDMNSSFGSNHDISTGVDQDLSSSHDQISIQPNGIGSCDLVHGGHVEGHVDDNIFGGQDVHGIDGKMHESSTPNVFGGQNVHGAHGEDIYHTKPNIFKGVDIYDQHGAKVGHTVPNIFGGQDIINSHGQKIAGSQPNIFGGLTVKSK